VAEAVANERAADVWEVHADNELTVAAWVALSTQWRVSSGMAVVRLGLDYAVIPGVLALTEVPRRERHTVFDGLRTMEAAALEVFNAKAKAERDG
jgi:hypothetical protein